jgi:hypothetical protein
MIETWLAICLCAMAADGPDRPVVLTIVGAAGEPEYAAEFRRSADLWKAAAAKAGVESMAIGLSEESSGTDRDRLRAILVTGRSTAARPSSTCAGPIMTIQRGSS